MPRVNKCLLLFLLILVQLAVTAFGQAGKGQQAGNEKANRRPEAEKKESSSSQNESSPSSDGPEIVVETKLVTVPVKALDRSGKFISGLTREDFEVFEDGVPQDIALFSNESEPFTVALVLDMSYSAKFKASEIQAAAIEFINQLKPNDRVMIVSFDKDVHLLSEPTSDRKALVSAIRKAEIKTGTSLFEAVDFAVREKLRGIEGRKALVLFTDGVDTTSSKAGAADNLAEIAESDILAYTIRYDTYADVQRMKNSPTAQLPQGGSLPGSQLPPGTTPPINPGEKSGIPFPVRNIPSVGLPDEKGTTREEYDRGERYLVEMAEKTGGEVFVADSIVNLSRAFTKIANSLRQTYSLGYYPSEDSKKANTRKIKVRVKRTGVALKYKESYQVSSRKNRS
ncbi:MAG TPA: VWA domain-containing protein [Pyrinomonadaceae bacterium]|nr:VWA domain-containing protein [Pyrinomonadaceae bacterium]